ncbi:potassium transporter TrkG [Agathobaculum sp. NTUH-O15-33]|uniref:TrkH family potassium uptake protein n=1 Tax=Agathobaculum sp. NTUH-O15-33 TaxID=3079302 RepID=UPI00295870A5|nr:potassium transporter TrkG [Agathobaculum sp. NTUH-O15-33]WNX83249.1 potassium transporter TrkG [Agathobaculum sp. NTUH-O15-33]
MALGFIGIILLGAVLLTLPVSSRNGDFTSFQDALFTATSATCVTGLVVHDTATYWSNFGHLVILLLIQIGGLGFMTMASLASFLLRRTIALRERMVMGAGLNMTENAGIVRLTRRVLFGTLAFEGAGAVVLALRFIPLVGPARGVKMGVFHAVSAFCNAGFDLMGEPGRLYPSVTAYVSDPIVSLTLMVLVVVGGLGFFVWSDVWDKRNFKRLHLHTKLVLVTTGILLLAGFGLTLLFEWGNPSTLGQLNTGGKLLAAGFQSVTLRTAGFNTIDQAALTGPSQALGCFLMLIGGSPGSTAGGVKTVTAAILLLSTLSALRGRTTVFAFGRAIAPRSVMNAVTMLIVGFMLSLTGACAISFLEAAPFHQCLFEAVSAFATVGLSMGLTPALGTVSHFILIALMYLGRVGVLTLGVAVLMRRREPPKMHYPEGFVMVG